MLTKQPLLNNRRWSSCSRRWTLSKTTSLVPLSILNYRSRRGSIDLPKRRQRRRKRSGQEKRPNELRRGMNCRNNWSKLSRVKKPNKRRKMRRQPSSCSHKWPEKLMLTKKRRSRKKLMMSKWWRKSAHVLGPELLAESDDIVLLRTVMIRDAGEILAVVTVEKEVRGSIAGGPHRLNRARRLPSIEQETWWLPFNN